MTCHAVQLVTIFILLLLATNDIPTGKQSHGPQLLTPCGPAAIPPLLFHVRQQSVQYARVPPHLQCWALLPERRGGGEEAKRKQPRNLLKQVESTLAIQESKH
jgi:hypothetical protein